MVFSRLRELSDEVLDGKYRKSEIFEGASLVVTDEIKTLSSEGFYPTPRYVVTPYAGEVGWLLDNLVEIFSKLDGYSFWKEELFGRLGNMIIRAISHGKEARLEDLLLAIIHEAYSCAEQLESSSFKTLMVTSGNVIYEDLITSAEQSGSISESAAESFLRLHRLL